MGSDVVDIIKFKKKSYYRALIIAGISISMSILMIMAFCSCYIRRKLSRLDSQLKKANFDEKKAQIANKQQPTAIKKAN